MLATQSLLWKKILIWQILKKLKKIVGILQNLFEQLRLEQHANFNLRKRTRQLRRLLQNNRKILRVARQKQKVHVHQRHREKVLQKLFAAYQRRENFYHSRSRINSARKGGSKNGFGVQPRKWRQNLHYWLLCQSEYHWGTADVHWKQIYGFVAYFQAR